MKYFQPEVGIALCMGLSEVDIERKLAGLNILETLLDQIFEIFGNNFNNRQGFCFLNGSYTGIRLVSARSGKQRNVVPVGLIPVRTAKIKDL